MSYRLQNRASLGEELRRIALEELDGALGLLAGPEGTATRAVHESRKHLKKARAVLRLLRDELGAARYGRLRDRLRDAGLQLSELRDAQVAVETFDKLRDAYPEALADGAFGATRVALEERSRASHHQASLGEILELLNDARQRLATTDRITRRGWKVLGPAIERLHEQGVAAHQSAQRKPTIVNLHEWRKRSKDTWYQLRILEPVWPEVLGVIEDEAHRLTEHLGDDHDLAMLRTRLLEDPALAQGAARVTLSELIDGRRAELQAAAFGLGARLYAEEPDAYADRLEAYWRVWRDEPQDDVVHDANLPAGGAAAAPPAAEPGGPLTAPTLGSVEAPPRISFSPGAVREPALTAPKLGSVERPPVVMPRRPLVLDRPTMPAPALGSIEHTRSGPASPPRMREAQLPAPPMGTIERPVEVPHRPTLTLTLPPPQLDPPPVSAPGVPFVGIDPQPPPD